MAREQVASNDAIWLQDSATNPMVINVVIITDRLDPDLLKAAFQLRIFGGPEPGRFERLHCRIAGAGHRRDRERDPDFDLDRHIIAARVEARRGAEAVLDYVGREASRGLDPVHPQWAIHVIEGFEADATALLVRVHHSIGDGEALIGLLFSLVDAPAGGQCGPVPGPARPSPRPRWPGRMLRAAAVPLSLPGIFLRRLAWIPDRSPMHGPPLSGRKRVAWTRPLDLDLVKQARVRLGATVNDVLMSSVSGAFCRYLEAHGDTTPSRFLVSMPVSLRSLGKPLRCDNHFAPVPLELPAGPGPRARRVLAVKARMDQMKGSAVPAAIYNLQRVLVAFLPQAASRFLIDFLADKCTAVVTNIKGPSRELTLEGCRVRSIIFWVPQRSKIGVGISILSFSGKVQVGVIADEALVPDPADLVRAFEQEFEGLRTL